MLNEVMLDRCICNIVLVEMPSNLKSVDLLVVVWWMSENWGNVCEFRVECEVNDERMRVKCETNDERMMSG